MFHATNPVPLLIVALLLPLTPAEGQSAFGPTDSLPDTLRTGDGIPISVRLVYGSEREKAAIDDLRTVLANHELKPWIYTREVLITEEGYPHSHPVLTLTTESEYDKDPVRHLSTFIHEQLHWYEEAPENEEAIGRAIDDLKEMYPDPPSHEKIGTRSAESTYLHLIIGWQVLDAITEFAGEDKARQLLSSVDHYEWVYETVLRDTETIGAVVGRHGLVITPAQGLPAPSAAARER